MLPQRVLWGRHVRVGGWEDVAALWSTVTDSPWGVLLLFSSRLSGAVSHARRPFLFPLVAGRQRCGGGVHYRLPQAAARPYHLDAAGPQCRSQRAVCHHWWGKGRGAPRDFSRTFGAVGRWDTAWNGGGRDGPCARGKRAHVALSRHVRVCKQARACLAQAVVCGGWLRRQREWTLS